METEEQPDENPCIADRIAQVQERIAAACQQAGRAQDAVRLLAVSKTRPPEHVREASDAGLLVFGENRIQEAQAKIPACPGHLSWHLIGHLQSNKVRPAVALFDMIHSVDSLKLLEHLDQAAGEAGRVLPLCIQVNVSGEASKFGLAPDALAPLLERASSLMQVDVLGLMTIPPFTPDPEDARPHFARLRALRDQARAETGFPLDELSMGMSHDLEVAVSEGATWLRIGTDLFGPRGS